MAISSVVLEPTRQSRGSNKGAEIRAKIAANRAERLRIAEAMKNEAGVTEHTVNKEDLGGLAYNRDRRNFTRQRAERSCSSTRWRTNADTSCCTILVLGTRSLAVKEIEAESYAHQAFREHGMTLPRKLSSWGRKYVASWIERDRAANIPIDPRAIAYARGRRSPYEPLRMVPATWKIFRAAAPTIAARQPWLHSLRAVFYRVLQRLVQNFPKPVADEALTLFRLASSCTLHGTTVCLLGLLIIQAFHPVPDLFPKQPGDVTWAEFLTAVAGGLWLANFAVLWRMATR